MDLSDNLASGQGLLFLSLAVLLLLLASTADVVWLQRGEGFSGAGSFDALAAFKLGARLTSVAFGAWLFLLVGGRGWLLRDPAVRWFSAFFVLAAGSATYAAVPVVSFTRALSFLGVLFFAVVLVRTFSEAGRFQQLWDGLYRVLGLYVVAVFVLSMALDMAGLGAVGGKRLATLYGPNGAGSLAGLAVVWSFVRLHRGIGGRFEYFVACMSAVFLVLTLSRGALGLTVLTCGGYAVWRGKGLGFAAGGLALAGLALLVLSLQQGEGVSLVNYFARDQSSDQIQALNGRIPLYGYLLTQQFPQYPFLGVGFQMLSESSLVVDLPAELAIERGSWLAGHAHNGLIHVLIGTGLVGLFVFLGGWVALFRGLRRVRWAAPSAWEASVPLLFFLSAHALVETTLTGTVDPNYILLCLIIGVGASTWPIPSGGPARTGGRTQAGISHLTHGARGQPRESHARASMSQGI